MEGFGRDRVEYICNKRVAFNGSSMSEAEIMDVNRRGKVRASRMENFDDYNSYSPGSRSTTSYELNENGPVYPLRSIPPTNQWGMSSEGQGPYCPPAGGGSGDGRVGYFPYLDRGQSGYSMNSYYERGRYLNHDSDSFENLENNRAELLRKLGELEDQLSRSCHMTDIPKGPTTSSHAASPDDLASRYTRLASRHDPYFSERGHAHESVSYHGYHDDYCNRNSYLPPKVDPSGFYNRRSQNEHSSPDYHHYLNRNGPQGYSPGGFNLHPSHSQQSPAHDSIVLGSQSDGFNHNRRGYMVETHRGQVWHPIAGGAPIVSCFNCFELLKLSRKHLSLAKSQHKLKCGACSSVISLQLGKRGPDTGHVDQVSTEIEDEITNENARYQHDGLNSADMNDDHQDPKVSAAEKQLDRLSEDEQNTENLASGKHASQSEECLDHCSANIVMNKSKRFDVDQNYYVQDSGVATEISLNSSVSQDFVDQSDEPQPMVNKGARSNFANVTRDGFTESRQAVEFNESQVIVNGHLIPERLVQKAEKLAGPIQPGEYWYDVHAGFWGVMGHPCLGLIMPNIEEFNYPMPEKCGAGNTGVFVNGRELHQKDLAVLACRGLPDAKHGSYLVEISGKVVDEHTGEELHSLGRLAPTVERAKHGFGMKVPSFIARLLN